MSEIKLEQCAWCDDGGLAQYVYADYRYECAVCRSGGAMCDTREEAAEAWNAVMGPANKARRKREARAKRRASQTPGNYEVQVFRAGKWEVDRRNAGQARARRIVSNRFADGEGPQGRVVDQRDGQVVFECRTAVVQGPVERIAEFRRSLERKHDLGPSGPHNAPETRERMGLVEDNGWRCEP